MKLKQRPIVVLLAGAALGLAACGSSSHQSSTSTSTVALIATTTSSSSATTTSDPANKKSSKRDSHQKSSKSSSHRSSSASGATTGATTAPAHHVHRPPVRHSHKVTPIPKQHVRQVKVTGPTPIVCLFGAGLIAAKREGADRWIAYNDATLKPVFVDGPFKNVGAAKADVASLQGVEYVKRGGLYVVGAILTSHLNKAVDNVAACLSTTRGSGSLTF
jgi:hypothetical protein